MKNNKNITIKHIAQTLGISTSTVSRALHDAYDVSPETRRKVMALAEELDYKPNPYAVSLVKQNTKIIGVLLPEIAVYYFSMVVKGIQDVAYSVGYNTMFFISGESLEREKTILKNLNVNSLDGLLVSVSAETNTSEHFKKLIDKGLPIVFFDRVLDDIHTSKVIQDDYQGAFMATQHLIQQGFTRIAHLGGPKGINITQQRLQGYLDALTESGLPIRKNYITHSGLTEENGVEDMSKLLAIKPLPDALFCVNDRKAIGAMLALKRYGYKVPQHMGIIGFQNAPISEVVTPSLTTIEQTAYEIGAKSCQLLLDHIKTPDMEPQTVVMPTRLIVRESSRKT
ncbi:MAG: LacI family DNA-binding transcriptional regulator [Saprospiraceae bacterium]|nr:LacI family DNA-binding transcriptional regulator [Saprospiraceae bacterium]